MIVSLSGLFFDKGSTVSYLKFLAVLIIAAFSPSNGFTDISLKRNLAPAASFSSSAKKMSLHTFDTLSVSLFPCLSDNYGILIHDTVTKETAAVDTPCDKAYKAELKKRGWKLTHILNTHHHWDHTGGNLALKRDFGCRIIGSHSEKDKTPGIDVTVRPGEEMPFGSTTASVIDVGGHTNGHIAFYFPTNKVVFVGDALFSLGCGKMFEGNPKQMHSGLCRLRDLPDETTVFCAHEYTESNAKFAKSVEPNNVDLLKRIEEIKAKRKRGEPTVPSVLGDEKQTNPFLRVDTSEEIQKNVRADPEKDKDYEIFAKVRKAKDNFRGNISL